MKKDPLKISGMYFGVTPKVFRNDQKLRSNMTEPEMRICDYLKTKPNNYKFRRQHPISGYILDFYCRQLRISIEIYGNYHLIKEQRIKDLSRTDYLKSLGVSELRFTNDQDLNGFQM